MVAARVRTASVRAAQPGLLLREDATRGDGRDAQPVVRQELRHLGGIDVLRPTQCQLDAVVAQARDLGDGDVESVAEDDECGWAARRAGRWPGRVSR